jgi:thioredoxin-related protein
VGRLRKWPRVSLVVLAVALVLAGLVGCRSSVETKVNFLRDWEVAKEQAASDNKPIMINFYSSACPACKQLDTYTFSSDEVSAFINEHLVPIKRNTLTSRLHQSYSIKYVPTTVFTDASGKEIDRIVGYLPPAEFQDKMKSILGDRVT